MPTAYYALFPGGVAPDGTGTGNNTAALSQHVSTGTQTANTPKATQLVLLFDADTDEHWMWTFLLPGDYASGGTLRGKFGMTSAITGNVILKGGQVSTIDASTDDRARVFAAADLTAGIPVPGTLGQTKEFSITLTATNMAANRKVTIFVGRDADNGSDTAAGDLELTAVNFEYTTT